MKVITKHLLRNLGLALVFPSLILVGAVWLTQSLRYVKVIVNHNVTFVEFLSLVGFLLPDLLAVVLPVAMLISTVIVYSKMNQDHELVILKAAGLSNWVICRPALILSSLVMLYVLFSNAFLSPIALQHFRNKNYQMKNQFTTALIQEGQFNTLRGMTVYTRKRHANGLLEDIYIYSDGSGGAGKQRPVYVVLAETGQVVSEQDGFVLYLKNGRRQEKNPKTGEISFFNFEQLRLNLSALGGPEKARKVKIYEMSLPELLSFSGPVTKKLRHQMHSEAHRRILSPLLTILFVLSASAVLLRGEYSRVSKKSKIYSVIAICAAAYILIMSMVNAQFAYSTLLAYFVYLLFLVCSAYFIQIKKLTGRVL